MLRETLFVACQISYFRREYYKESNWFDILKRLKLQTVREPIELQTYTCHNY